MKTLATAGERMGGRCAKTAKRILSKAGVPMHRIGGSLMVKDSDLEAFFESQRVEPVADLRSRLQVIRDKVRARRQAVAP
jgi:hypothetical protein